MVYKKYMNMYGFQFLNNISNRPKMKAPDTSKKILELNFAINKTITENKFLNHGGVGVVISVANSLV